MFLICSRFDLADELASIARRYGFESLVRRSISSDMSFKWKSEIDCHSSARTFCYLCSINQHEHQPTKPRDESQVTLFHQRSNCLT